MMKKIALFCLILGLASLACDTSELMPPTTPTTTPTTPTTLESVLSVSGEGTAGESDLTVTAAVALNLRNVPDAAGPIDSQVIERMPGGSVVKWLHTCSGEWAKIQYGGRVGWAISYLLDPMVCQ